MAIGLVLGWAASSPDAGFAAADRQKVSFLATLSAPFPRQGPLQPHTLPHQVPRQTQLVARPQ